MAAGVLLSPPIFRAGATIGIEDAVDRYRSEAVRTAADLAVSRPVLVRAATSLIETHAMVPPSSVLDRFGVLAAGPSRTEQASRLADRLHALVHPTLGASAVTLDITAEAPDAAQAAQVATAVGNALVAYRDDSLADLRRTREMTAASRLAALRNSALTAHQRLTALAGTDVDPTQARATSADQAAAAQARVASLRAIIASGTPPLGAGKELPQSIESLQTAYLDLTRKLAVASETLGDRHTTIIALQDGVRRTSAALTAEWKRLLRIAEADYATARQREASLGKAETAPDAARQSAIDEARRAARAADDAFARAAAPSEPAVDEQSYRLIAPAPVPLAAAAGWSLLARVLMALGAGAVAFALALVAVSWRKAASLPEAAVEPLVDTTESRESEPVHEPEAAYVAADASPIAHAFFDPEPVAAKDLSMPASLPQPVSGRELDPDLQDALGEIVADLVMAEPANGTVPTIMVAANEIAGGTMAVAVALADVAVERGMRVLLVEGPRQKPELAAAAEPSCEPMLIDLFGNLRIVLQAEMNDALFVAPFFRNGTSIAAALARNTQAACLDEVAAEFDIIVVDGCRAVDSAAAGLTADAYLRVGRFASRRETDRFLNTFDIAPERLVGTIADATFVAHVPDRTSWRPIASQPVEAAPPTSPSRAPQAGTFQARPVETAASRTGATQNSASQNRVSQAGVSARPAYPRRAGAR